MDDTKRLILAIALSVIVMIVYFMIKPKPQPPQTQQEQAAAGQGQDQTLPPQDQQEDTSTSWDTSPESEALPDIFSKKKKEKAPDTKKPGFEPVKEDIIDEFQKEVVVETDFFKAVFTNKGAGLKSFILKNYNDDTKNPLDLISSKVDKKFGTHEIYPFYFSPFEDDEETREVFLDLNRRRFLYEGELTVHLGSQDTHKEIVFKYANVDKNITVIKRFVFSNSSYVFEVDYRVIKDGQIIDAPVVFGPDLENKVSKNRVMQTSLRLGAYNGQEVKTITFSRLKTQGEEGELVREAKGSMGSQFHWAVYDTNYFAAVFKTRGQVQYYLLKTKTGEKEKPELYSYMIVTKPTLVYMGPKDEQILADTEKDPSFSFPGISRVVDYGWGFIGSIASIMLTCIVFIHGFIPNYGWALVVFTIFIKILLFPLTYTSSVSMAKMQTLQPKIKAIKKKYKNLRDPDQRRKMNEETMALYKQEKVNPASGCLPMLLQMPVLIAFFRLLPISINFRHEPWILWITDLSVKDPIYLLPILMGATQIIVSKMSPTSGEGAQKKLMYIMPVVFVLLFMNYSAGLNLYWFVSNLLQMVQQYIINKKIFIEKKEEDRTRRAQKRKKGGKAK
ncbi:MAG: membrane protein insertase YidC [Candidatus Aminicenantes bacterium]|nr:MAG: membrane protein insertase YidC [Candidatus Aminicenantes bacterium]